MKVRILQTQVENEISELRLKMQAKSIAYTDVQDFFFNPYKP